MSSNLTRGKQSTIDTTGISNGKVRFAYDTGRLFIDTELERVEITDIVYGLTQAEINALQNPLPKIYLSSDSHMIMTYNFKTKTWIVYSGEGTSRSAINDGKGQIITSTYIKNMYFDDDNNIVLVDGDDNIKATITNPLTSRVKELEEKMDMILSAISIEKV